VIKLQQRQLEKHYANDWAKAKVHTLLGEMLENTLLTFKKPKDLRVLHFSGIDAQETKSVYLARGIPAKNIVSLERDANITKSIEGMDLGIRVVNKTLEAYIEESISNGGRIDFDVVSLDFTGPITMELLYSINDIARNCGNHILFHSANLLKRDPNTSILYGSVVPSVRNAMGRLDGQKGISSLDKPNEIANSLNAETSSLADHFSKFTEDFESNQKTEVKRQYYSYLILQHLFAPSIQNEQQLIRFLFGDGITNVEPYITGVFNRFTGRNAANLSEVFQDSMLSFPLFINYLENVKELQIGALCKHYGLDSCIAGKLGCCIQDAVNDISTLTPKASKNYTYISESGSPMIGSIFFASRPRYAYEASREVARLCGFPNEFKIVDPAGLTKTYNKYIRLANTENEHLRDLYFADKAISVEFLGNSSKPVLSKKRFLEELESGSTMGEVKEKYRGWIRMPLAQWKAHYTMGTYGKTADLLIENTDDSSLEKITKDEAVDLLSSGIPVEEIYAAYPTSFTEGQLRAYKAHITMGTYQRKD
jgi:hypothetical protein